MFDVLTTGAVVDELRRTVLDGRIQRLGMVDALTIGAEIYARGRRWHLIASADAQNPRVHLTRSMPSTDPNMITPFGLQLRKYVRGGFLIDVQQPPLERVIRLSIAKRMGPAGEPEEESDVDEDEDDIWSGENVSRLELVVEVMGRHSNLVLVDEDGLIRESAKRVTPSMSRVRPILPKRPYELPPPPDKPDPRQLTTPSVEQLITASKPSDKLSDVLVRGFRGISPQIAREVAYRVAGETGAKIEALGTDDARALAQAVRGMFQPLLTGAWDPHIYEKDDLPIGYGAIQITHLGVDAEAIAVDSISEAIESAQDASGEVTPKDHAQRRARVVQSIDSAIGSVNSRLRSLRQQYERTRDTEQYRRWGETIYAYLWQIQPGDTELVAESENGEERIPLDPAKDPKEVAQDYFEEYRTSQRVAENLPERIEAAEHELAYLQELRYHAGQAEGFAAIESIRQELEEHTGGRHTGNEQKGHRASKKQSQKKVQPLTDDEGNLVYIGRSGRENAQVTFDIAGSDDYWLHARGVPGSHVILRLRVPAEEPDQDAVETAAALAAYYSGSRDSGTVEVDVTQRRHVRKIKGGGPGMVTYRNEYTIPVRPANEDELRKAGRIE